MAFNLRQMQQHQNKLRRNRRNTPQGDQPSLVLQPEVDPSSGDLVQSNPMDIGWMQDILTSMAQARTPVYPISGRTEVIIAQGFPLYIIPSNGEQLVSACKVAVAGSGTKAIATALEAAVPADVSLDLGTVASFGVRVKISDSINNFKYGIYDVQLLDGATVLLEAFIRPSTNVADFVMLGINSVGSQASIVRIAHPIVKVIAATSSVATGNSLTAETLNERDLGLQMFPGASAC